MKFGIKKFQVEEKKNSLSHDFFVRKQQTSTQTFRKSSPVAYI